MAEAKKPVLGIDLGMSVVTASGVGLGEAPLVENLPPEPQPLFFLGHGSNNDGIRALLKMLRGEEPPVQPIQPAQPREVFSVVADTVWTLWKEDTAKVWELLRQWACQETILLEASWQILSNGLNQYLLTHEAVIAELESWLVADEDRSHSAARLLPSVLVSLPSGMEGVQQRWEQSTDPLFRNRLPQVLSRLFSLDPNSCLSLFLYWARNGRAFDRIILSGLQKSSLSEELLESAYPHVDANLRHLGLLMGQRSRPLRKEIQRLLTALNNVRHRTVERSRQGRKRRRKGGQSFPG